MDLQPAIKMSSASLGRLQIDGNKFPLSSYSKKGLKMLSPSIIQETHLYNNEYLTKTFQ